MPVSDRYMAYDANAHRYVLTDAFVCEKMNISLEPLLDNSLSLDLANGKAMLLDRVSAMIYSYIYRLCPLYYYKERELALVEAYREPLMLAMAEQLRYVIFNGDISLASGLDIHGGSALDRRAMRSREIAPMARDILSSAGILQICVPPGVREIEPRYVEEGY